VKDTETVGEHGTGEEILVGTSAGNRHFGRRRLRWKVNAKLDFIEIGVGVLSWIELVHDTDT